MPCSFVFFFFFAINSYFDGIFSQVRVSVLVKPKPWQRTGPGKDQERYGHHFLTCLMKETMTLHQGKF